jgi:hypothetical protein
MEINWENSKGSALSAMNLVRGASNCPNKGKNNEGSRHEDTMEVCLGDDGWWQ